MNTPNSSTDLILNNRYQLLDRIGSGGMSTIYRALDLTLERNVAVKVLREEFSRNPAYHRSFHEEAKSAASLSHPNIITVHDFGFDQDYLFLVMEYVPGTDLKILLNRKGRFTVDEGVPVLIQACAGLGYAHRSGLIHCDVKPHNLIITADNRVKVTDFGIARAFVSIRPGEKSNVVWGSPQYFSPEQASGEAPLPASDVYSLGVILYEMLTGRLPFIADSATELARLHREALPPNPRQFNPAIPPALESIILKVLEKEPSKRYRTADQMGRALINISETRTNTDHNGETIPPPIDVPQPLPPLQRPISSYSEKKSQSDEERNMSLSYPSVSSAQQNRYRANRKQPAFDWITWGLLIIALLAMGGLLPLWLWVYFAYTLPR